MHSLTIRAYFLVVLLTAAYSHVPQFSTVHWGHQLTNSKSKVLSSQCNPFYSQVQGHYDSSFLVKMLVLLLSFWMHGFLHVTEATKLLRVIKLG